jgi:transposase-like protein
VCGESRTHGFGAERRGRLRRLGSDKDGQTIDFLLTPHRESAAAEAFLHKAIRTQGLPEEITIDQSGSHTAANNYPPAKPEVLGT